MRCSLLALLFLGLVPGGVFGQDEVAIEGRLTILHVDRNDGTSEYFHEIQTDAGAVVTVRYLGGKTPLVYLSGSRVKVRGRMMGKDRMMASPETLQLVAPPR